MRLRWRDIGSRIADAAEGSMVTVAGHPVALSLSGRDLPDRAKRFLLTEEPSCCPGCAPRHREAVVDVQAAADVPVQSGILHLSGRWHVMRKEQWAPRYQLSGAILVEPPAWGSVTRRQALAAGPLICLAGMTAVGPGEARAAIEAGTTVDLHSHAGGIANVARMRSGEAFAPVAEKMCQGGMAVACLAIVSDGPTHKLMPDGRLHPYRTPKPGELYEYSEVAFGRLHQMAQTQGLAIITDSAALKAARAGTASAIIAAEGADFLEGRPDRINEAHDKWALRHLQLTHYRVNELGDIQTEPPVHGGLTDTGVEVIRRCNKLGIVVDVAHGTFDLVKRAAAVTTKPLVLSHTSLSAKPSRFSRRITPEHARLIADTDGVIGIWPPAGTYPTLAALAAGMVQMADVVGVDHVGLGTDMRGLVGPGVFPNYDALPGLAGALLTAGFSPTETSRILGGNYVRVFAACVT